MARGFLIFLSGQFIGSIYWVKAFLYLCFFGKDYLTIGLLEFGSLEFGSPEFNLLESPSAYCEFPPNFREQVESRAQQE